MVNTELNDDVRFVVQRKKIYFSYIHSGAAWKHLLYVDVFFVIALPCSHDFELKYININFTLYNIRDH